MLTNLAEELVSTSVRHFERITPRAAESFLPVAFKALEQIDIKPRYTYGHSIQFAHDHPHFCGPNDHFPMGGRLPHVSISL